MSNYPRRRGGIALLVILGFKYLYRINWWMLCALLSLSILHLAKTKSVTKRVECDQSPLWRIADSHPFGIFYSWDDDGESAENKATKDLCTRCRAELVNFTNKVREEFWEQLPSFFRLLGWSDLKDG